MHCIALHCAALHYIIILHHITVYCSVLHIAISIQLYVDLLASGRFVKGKKRPNFSSIASATWLEVAADWGT